MIRLSICMIVKNEEKNLVKCLSSLEEIRKEISSELIVVDTGSSDKTVEIAKRYTDLVYQHEWNNNFADMRNISIGYATGEWILVFDADEMIDQPIGILETFKNRELLELNNTLLLQVRDFTKSSDESMFFEYISAKFFKNDGEFHFEGSIHNQAMMKEPFYCVPETILKHYGYDCDDHNLIVRKVERTSTMLIKELENSPEDVYYLFQLASTYRMGKQYELAYPYIEKAFKLVEKEGFKEIYLYVIKQYILALKDLALDKKVELLRETLIEYINEDLDLSFYFADTMYKLKYYNLAVEHYKRYLCLLEVYQRGENRKIDLSDSIQTSHLKELVYFSLAELYYEMGEYKVACNYYHFISEEQFCENMIIHYLESLICTGDQEAFDEMIYHLKLLNNRGFSTAAITAVEEIISEMKLADLNEWTSRLKVLSTSYEILFLCRKATAMQQSIDDVEMLNYFKQFYLDSEVYYADFLYFARLSRESVLEVLSDYSNQKIYKLLKYLNKKYDDFKISAVEMIEASGSFRTLRVKNCLEIVLITEADLEEEFKVAIGLDLIINKIKWLYDTYKIEVIETTLEYLEKKDRIYADLNLIYLNRLNFSDFKEKYEKSLDPVECYLFRISEEHWTELLQMIELIRSSIDENQLTAIDPNHEFAALKEMMKIEIEQLKRAEAYGACMSVIEAYLKIMPLDLEIFALKSDIVVKKVQYDDKN